MRKKKTVKKKQPPSPILRGFIQLVCALILFVSLLTYVNDDPLHNWLGYAGHLIGWSSLYLFGLSSLILPIFIGWWAIRQMIKKPIPNPRKKLLFFSLLFFSLSILLSMMANHHTGFASTFDDYVYSNYYPHRYAFDPSTLRHYLGGVPFHHLYCDTPLNFQRLLGGVGSLCIFLSLFITSFLLFTNLSLKPLLLKVYNAWKNRRPRLAPVAVNKRPFASVEEVHSPPPLVREDPLKKRAKVHVFEEKKSKELPPPPPQPIKASLEGYQIPPSSLLTEIAPVDQSQLTSDLKRQAEVLEETLSSFGIDAKVGDIHCGPTITSFEVHPAFGVKVQKIKALEKDLALNLQARSIRIIAPIPGKAAVGIEIPNLYPQEVSFRELLEEYRGKLHIPLLLGKMVNGESVVTDLAKMPHLIIAGATGSGKSVCINSIVMSIMMTARPDEIKLVMIDPKKVELTAYTHLPHMLAPVITEPAGAVAALNWLTKEMDRRYEMFRQLGIRNIHSFNTRKINEELETSLDIEIPKKMPFIVVIIDELADLMMISSSDIETPIARIAQMARAVGIHLILATQRPSREVITGLIKANFPTRIAFKVSSRVNSQIIIDENGAESLLGNGDLLFMPPGTSSLLRAQGAFIRDDDINKTIHYICSQAPTNYLIPNFDTYRDPLDSDLDDSSPRDALYDDAKNLVLETGTASTTFIQRKLKVGYARAAGLMDQLEDRGVIGPSEGAKPRKIYYPDNT
ncbi:MAG: DNA translocase FtsK [Chlamydiales bacterium]|nr:DNA translocase FtsK [Chlamydiales bacterium]MCH9619811.1 DNA translocase FtsK [Chlamydiales bacterium]MCH9623417.1 DNA translocase FtsK [Chlamydiales bacterium]